MPLSIVILWLDPASRKLHSHPCYWLLLAVRETVIVCVVSSDVDRVSDRECLFAVAALSVKLVCVRVYEIVERVV